MQKESPKYVTILWDVKKKLGLTISEYCLLDVIHKLSQKNGYCYASKKYLAETIDMSERGVFKLITKLIELGYLEKNPELTNLIRTTEKYVNSVILDYEQSSYTMQKSEVEHEQNSEHYEQSSYKDHEQSSYNNNTIDNNSNNNINKEKIAKKLDFDFSFIHKEVLESVKEFVEFRKEIKKPMKSQTQLVKWYKLLRGYSNGSFETAINIIDTAIANGWQSIQEPKQKNVFTTIENKVDYKSTKQIEMEREAYAKARIQRH